MKQLNEIHKRHAHAVKGFLYTGKREKERVQGRQRQIGELKAKRKDTGQRGNESKTTVPAREPPRTLHWELAEPDATRTTGAQERQGLTVTGGTGGEGQLHTYKLVCTRPKEKYLHPCNLCA